MDDLTAYESVRVWLADHARHWGEEDPQATPKLGVLAEFCRRVGKDPDAMIDECLREADEGVRIRLKARRRYIELIREFEATHERGREAGNVVRSFFIHNGIAMSADVAGM